MSLGREISAVTMSACIMHDAGLLNELSIEIGNVCRDSYWVGIVQGESKEIARNQNLR